jgi:cytochrome b561
MKARLDRLSGPLHLALAVCAAWLLASSPWLHMYRSLPRPAGLFNLGHVALGLAALLLVLVYIAICSQGGRWRLYFPWLAGTLGAVGSDVVGIARGRMPTVEGGGLFAMIEGLLLLALLATGLTGATWLVLQGTDAAMAWCDVHVVLARCFGGLMLAHLAAVSVHVLDLVRD